jgi:hypothetical protein
MVSAKFVQRTEQDAVLVARIVESWWVEDTPTPVTISEPQSQISQQACPPPPPPQFTEMHEEEQKMAAAAFNANNLKWFRTRLASY